MKAFIDMDGFMLLLKLAKSELRWPLRGISNELVNMGKILEWRKYGVVNDDKIHTYK